MILFVMQQNSSALKTLYHLPLSPQCRKVRTVLAEKRINFQLHEEKIWERRRDFLRLNPAGEVPVFVDSNNLVVCGADNISGYLEEIHPDPPLIGETLEQRVEIRRLVSWFDQKFNDEVTRYLVGEKLMKRIKRIGHPDGQKIRAGHTNIHYHLDYIEYLTDTRNWIAGDHFSLADITAASHLSCVDYIGDVPWEDHERARNWYARIKSRKSFRHLLDDYISGSAPASHYADIDF